MVSSKTLKLTQVALLAALVAVLQVVSYSIKIGTFNLSLVLIPIVVGGALFGAKTGALLGFVFGVVVTVGCVTGMDGGGNILWNVNPILTALTCLVKGTAAGFVGGVIATAMQRRNEAFLGVLLSAIAVPIVNTGLFCGAMWFFFRPTLTEWAGGQNVATYIFLGLIGINFLIEFGINLILSPTCERIVQAIRKVKA